MSKPQQHAVNLAAAIVKDKYGDLASEVVKGLLVRGRSTLGEIVRATPSIPYALIKQLLLMLIQQNCVQAYFLPEEQFVTGTRPPMTLYEPCLDRILQSIRSPRCLVFIKEHFGHRGYIAEETIKLLLEHGRLRLDQIIPALVANVQARWQREVQQQQGEGSEAAPGPPGEEDMQRVFVELVQERFVERAPPCTLPPPHLRPVLAAGKQRRTPAAKPGSLDWAKQQAEALRKLDLKAYEDDRFRLPMDVILGAAGQQAAAAQAAQLGDAMKVDADPTALGAAAEAAAAAAAAAKPGRKRKKAGSAVPSSSAAAPDAGEVPAAAAPAAKKRRGNKQVILDDEQEESNEAPAVKVEPAVKKEEKDVPPPPVLWRVNTEEFNRQFRHQACADLVGAKFGKEAKTVVRALLMHTGRFEQSLKADCSVGATPAEVEAALNRCVLAGQLQPLVHDTVEGLLEALSEDGMQLVACIEVALGRTYAVNLSNCMERVRLQQVLGTIRDRFHDTGLRIFNLLLHKGQFEQKNIADFAMQPQKDTRQVLYQMFRAGFLGMQDIPRTSDRAPSRSFYTWKVDTAAVFDHMSGVLYKSMLNIHLRLVTEYAGQHHLVRLVEAAQEAGEFTFNITDDMRATITELRTRSKLLKASLHRLDEMAALFSEY